MLQVRFLSFLIITFCPLVFQTINSLRCSLLFDLKRDEDAEQVPNGKSWDTHVGMHMIFQAIQVSSKKRTLKGTNDSIPHIRKHGAERQRNDTTHNVIRKFGIIEQLPPCAGVVAIPDVKVLKKNLKRLL